MHAHGPYTSANGERKRGVGGDVSGNVIHVLGMLLQVKWCPLLLLYPALSQSWTFITLSST